MSSPFNKKFNEKNPLNPSSHSVRLDSSKLDDISKAIEDFSGYEGSDKYKESLKGKGPRSYTPSSFTKEGSDRKYPYLSSRFLINPEVNDFQELTELEKQDLYNRDKASTVREDLRTLQQSRASRGISGNPKILEAYEKAARSSSKIGDNLRKARMEAAATGNEQVLSDAIFAAQEKMLENEILRRRPALDRDGNYMDNDPSYQNALMIDRYNNARRDAEAAQDASDYYRTLKYKLKRDQDRLSQFDERSGE